MQEEEKKEEEERCRERNQNSQDTRNFAAKKRKERDMEAE